MKKILFLSLLLAIIPFFAGAMFAEGLDSPFPFFEKGDAIKAVIGIGSPTNPLEIDIKVTASILPGNDSLENLLFGPKVIPSAFGISALDIDKPAGRLANLTDINQTSWKGGDGSVSPSSKQLGILL